MKMTAVFMGFLLGFQAFLIYLNPFNLPIDPYEKVIVCLTIAASILYFIAIAFLDLTYIVHIIGGIIAATIVCQIVLDAAQIPFFAYMFYMYGSLVLFNSLLFIIIFFLFKDDEKRPSQQVKTRVH